MVATSTLLKLTPFQWNPTFSSYTHQRHHPSTLFFSKPQRKSNLIRLKIACKHNQSSCADTDARSHSDPAQIWNNSFDQILIQIKKTLDSLKKPAVAAVLLGLLLFYDPNSALARSGGRIGGSSFSSGSSSSSSSSSFSSSSSSSETYSTPSYSTPSWSSSSSSYSKTYSKPSYSASYSEPKPWYQSYSYSEGTFDPIFSTCVFTMFLMFVLSVLVSRFFSDSSQDGNLTDTGKTSVLKLQVGLLGSGRTLQQDFNRLAESADTSTVEGLSYVLTEATLALLRHPDYCISCYSSVDVKQNAEDGENQFNQLSIEERGKFDEETLVNVNSIKRQSSKIRTANGFTNEYIVVTILVATKGIQKLQPINRIADLKEALQKLGSIPRNKILAVEVLWTPQDEKEALSERELLEDYPLLRPF